MNISRFFGSTNREAMRQVRLALGPDALIVSNRRVNGGVEILATDATTLPDGEPIEQLQDPPEAALQAYQYEPPEPSAPPAPRREPPPPADNPVELMSAIGELRGSLETRIDELMWGNQLRRAPQAITLFQTLLGFGFSTALLRAMLKRLPESLSARAALQWARAELVKHLPVLVSEEAFWAPGRVVALVGPTGVGKTTTIAKLAARCVRRNGAESLVLITTDTYRIGAHEQLKIYGQMLRVPVHVVQDADELRGIVARVRPDQTILIDNIGISQRDRYIGEQAAMLAAAGREVSRLLVLNASSHGDTLDEVARNYTNDGGSPLVGCIISKMDEASRPGAVLDTALRYQLRIHYVSNGQKVPQDLYFPTAEDLIDQALAQQAGTRALYSPTEADFAALLSMSQQQNDKARGQSAPQKSMLPGLLAMLGNEHSISPDQLLQAAAALDDHAVLAEARSVWRRQRAADPSAVPALATALKQVQRTGRQAWLESESPFAIALHDQLAVGEASGGRGRLRASFLLSGSGAGWVSPLQQISFSDGCLSSCGAAWQAAPQATELLAHQADWMHKNFGQKPLLQVFDSGSAILWRELHHKGLHWLAAASGGTRVHHEGSGTHLVAVAKTLAHQPLVAKDVLHGLDDLAGQPLGNVAIWVAEAPVLQVSRQKDDFPVRLVSVRIMHRVTGDTLKTLVAASNAPALYSTESLAAALLVRHEARAVARHAGRVWQQLSATTQPGQRQSLALASAQCGLAAWQLQQNPQFQSIGRAAAALAGKHQLVAMAAVPGLFRLFALADMAAEA